MRAINRPHPRVGLILPFRPLVLLVFFSVVQGGIARGEETKHDFTPRDLIDIQTITETQISPDGRQVAYVVYTADWNRHAYRPNIRLVDARGGKASDLTNARYSNHSPRWSPDGAFVAFLSDRDGSDQLWRTTPGEGEAVRLTSVEGEVLDYAWSPASASIAFLASEALSADQVQRIETGNDAVVVGEGAVKRHLHVLNLEDGSTQRITEGDFLVEGFSWSPDGRQIAYSRRPSIGRTSNYESDLYLVGIEEKRSRPLVVRPGMDTSPFWSPDGTTVAFTSTNGVVGDSSGLDINVVPSRGGKPLNLTDEVGERIYELYGWAANGASLLFKMRAGVTMQLFSITVPGRMVESLTSGDRVHDAFSFSSGRDVLMAFGASDPTMPRELHVSPIEDFEPVRLVVTNRELAAFRFPETRVVRWHSEDDREIEGLLALPIDRINNKPLPLLTVVHGGPAAAFSVGFAPQISADPGPIGLEPYPPQLFTQQGFAVFMPNIRGSSGYGRSFRRANLEDWGGADMNYVKSGIDMLIDQGIAEGDRLGLVGWSYGGFMTALAISRTDRFKVAQVGAGVTNMVSMYGTTDHQFEIEYEFGGPPWVKESLYQDRSAVMFVDRITTPTLIQHGENDGAVAVSQAEEFYVALSRQDVPVQFIRYPRSGHVVMEPTLNLDLWERQLEWYVRWLMNDSR